jgi:hypothetical protein
MNTAAAIAFYVAISVGILITVSLCFLSITISGKQWQEKARARRMAEHRMNARLLRLNL